MPPRLFPPPWTAEELDACFVVKDSAGQKLGHFYYEEEPGRRSAAKLLRTRPAAQGLTRVKAALQSYGPGNSASVLPMSR